MFNVPPILVLSAMIFEVEVDEICHDVLPVVLLNSGLVFATRERFVDSTCKSNSNIVYVSFQWW